MNELREMTPFEAKVLRALGMACFHANGPVSTQKVMEMVGGRWRGGNHRNALVRLCARGLAERTSDGRGRWEAVVR